MAKVTTFEPSDEMRERYWGRGSFSMPVSPYTALSPENALGDQAPPNAESVKTASDAAEERGTLEE
jgi:hypothetical protein